MTHPVLDEQMIQMLTPPILLKKRILVNKQWLLKQVNGVRVVSKLSLEYFRDKLVDHFDIMFTQHKLVWPSRLLHPPRLHS
jgi:hypothetical protein